jgi:hypothetical protein
MKGSFILLVFVALMLQMNGSGKSVQLPPASDMKTIGLIGGTSWYSTVDYYRYINEAVNDAYGNNTNPPLILYNMNQERIRELQAKGQWEEIAALLTQATIRLRAGGAQAMTLTYRYSTPRVYTRRWLWTSFSASTAWLTFDPINKQGFGRVTIHKVGGRQRAGLPLRVAHPAILDEWSANTKLCQPLCVHL